MCGMRCNGIGIIDLVSVPLICTKKMSSLVAEQNLMRVVVQLMFRLSREFICTISECANRGRRTADRPSNIRYDVLHERRICVSFRPLIMACHWQNLITPIQCLFHVCDGVACDQTLQATTEFTLNCYALGT
jgi:hypothetical protein